MVPTSLIVQRIFWLVLSDWVGNVVYISNIIINIDPLGKLFFCEKKFILVTGSAPLPPFCSFGRRYNWVKIVTCLLSYLHFWYHR